MSDETLILESSQIVSLEEEEEKYFYIKVNDTSGLKRNLKIKIKSIPKHGRLYLGDNVQIVNASLLPQTLSFPYENGFLMKYIGDLDYFNEPYQMIQSDDTEEVKFIIKTSNSKKSSLQAIRFNIVNVNDPIEITSSERTKSIKTLSSLSFDPHNCGQETWNQRCISRAMIDDIIVKDVDQNIDFVRVNVATSFGLVTLNKEYLNQTDFASCANRTQLDIDEEITWNCKGTGIGDTSMTFIAQPLELNNIFKRMTYESLEEGTDVILIKIYDGLGGDCLSRFEHDQKYTQNQYSGRMTIQNNCTTSEISIPINIGKYNSPELKSLRILPFQLIIAFGFACFTIFLFGVLVPCYKEYVASRTFDEDDDLVEDLEDYDESQDERFSIANDDDDYSVSSSCLDKESTFSEDDSDLEDNDNDDLLSFESSFDSADLDCEHEENLVEMVEIMTREKTGKDDVI